MPSDPLISGSLGSGDSLAAWQLSRVFEGAWEVHEHGRFGGMWSLLSSGVRPVLLCLSEPQASKYPFSPGLSLYIPFTSVLHLPSQKRGWAGAELLFRTGYR